jgi:hypothetical protein
MPDVADRLDRLAAHAPAGAVDPDRLWSRGRRRQGRRWAVAVACAVVLAGIGALAAAPLARLVEPPVADHPDSAWVLPDVVRQPGGWEPAFGHAPGRLSAIGVGSRSGWLSWGPAYWGVSAATGESRWLDLPATVAGDAPVLSADGTKVAFWSSVGDAATRTDDQFPEPTVLHLRDLVTGAEQEWAPVTEHGLMTLGMQWAGDTLWFDAGAFRDDQQNSAQTSLYTWTWGQQPRDVSDLYGVRDLSTVTQGPDGFLASDGTATRRSWRVGSAGGASRLRYDVNGSVSTPALSPDGRLVAGVQQGRSEQMYGVALPLLVGEVVGGRARMSPVEAVDAAFVLGWRSASEVVVAAPADRDGNGEPDVQEVSVAAVADPADFGFSFLVDIRADQLPQFASDAWTAEVVVGPDAPFAPDPRWFAGGTAALVLLLVVGWRGTRSRRGHP